MATITYKQLQGVRDAMDKIDVDTKKAIAEVVNRVGTSDLEALRTAMLEELQPVCEMAIDLSSQLAQAVFSGWRYSAIGLPMETVGAVGVWDEGKFAAAVNTAVKTAADGGTPEQVCNVMNSRSSYDIKRSYGETILANCAKDPTKPRYARVPGHSEHYSDGCPFCRMLSGRGFVYHTKKMAGEFNHYHADCTCTVVCSWDDSPTVQGYDPDSMLEEYYDARKYAEDNITDIRDREKVALKTHTRYRNGIRVGRRTEDYSTGAIQANDISAAYRDLGIARKLNPKK